MARVAHIIGNGDSSLLYQNEPRKGLKLACNAIGFAIPEKYATVIVDYKFMDAMKKGIATVDGDWILGFRPKHWMELNPQIYVKWSKQVKEFYTALPDYVANYTDFNCGHMAAHYAANKLKADEIHMYGFDSIFDFNLRSVSDIDMPSDRGNMNNLRLADNWRPVWQSMFREFKDVKFILHYYHKKLKINVDGNVHIKTYEYIPPKEEKETGTVNMDNISDA